MRLFPKLKIYLRKLTNGKKSELLENFKIIFFFYLQKVWDYLAVFIDSGT